MANLDRRERLILLVAQTAIAITLASWGAYIYTTSTDHRVPEWLVALITVSCVEIKNAFSSIYSSAHSDASPKPRRRVADDSESPPSMKGTA